MVSGFCVENPFLPVLSLHWYLDHLKLSYYLSGLTTIALLLLVCIIPAVLVVINFWKIFWLFLAFCLQLVPICGDINVHLDVECGDRSGFYDILQFYSLIQGVSGRLTYFVILWTF